MNGPQLKAVLERGYRNYYYYKYVPGYGGYSYYTTCMLDTNSVGQIYYNDTVPGPARTATTSRALIINGKPVDFADATKYYKVSTVNYLAAGLVQLQRRRREPLAAGPDRQRHPVLRP